MKKKNGFTLIELLAVIVVLAVLILLAMPKVTQMMEKARRNSFAVEATEIVKIAQTAYSDLMLQTLPEGVTKQYNCFTVDKLIDKGYLDKKKDEVEGYVYIKKSIDANGKETITYVTGFKKGKYYISSTASSNDKSAKYDASSVKATAVDIDCPSATAQPDVSPY